MFSAFAVFSEQHPEYILNVYGDGQNRSKLEQLIKELDLESRIVLHGNRPDAVEQIKDAGMFVMTSRYEGMPNALIEAMACGLPCVCTDCDFGPAELIDNGESGLLVPVDDVQAIAAAMAQIADNQALAEKLSNGALEIRRTHSRDAICKQYRDYIESIVRA
jgi:glycosyltransferase involved in cell wall biosynthesis